MKDRYHFDLDVRKNKFHYQLILHHIATLFKATKKTMDITFTDQLQSHIFKYVVNRKVNNRSLGLQLSNHQIIIMKMCDNKSD